MRFLRSPNYQKNLLRLSLYLANEYLFHNVIVSFLSYSIKQNNLFLSAISISLSIMITEFMIRSVNFFMGRKYSEAYPSVASLLGFFIIVFVNTVILFVALLLGIVFSGRMLEIRLGYFLYPFLLYGGYFFQFIFSCKTFTS